MDDGEASIHLESFGEEHPRTHGQKAQEIISYRAATDKPVSHCAAGPTSRRTLGPAACLVSSPPLPRRPPAGPPPTSRPPTIRASRSFPLSLHCAALSSRPLVPRTPAEAGSHGRPPRRGGRGLAAPRRAGAGGGRPEPRRRRAPPLRCLPLRLLRLQRRAEPRDLREHRARAILPCYRSTAAGSRSLFSFSFSSVRSRCRRATWAPSRWGSSTPPSRSSAWPRRPWSRGWGPSARSSSAAAATCSSSSPTSSRHGSARLDRGSRPLLMP